MSSSRPPHRRKPSRSIIKRFRLAFAIHITRTIPPTLPLQTYLTLLRSSLTPTGLSVPLFHNLLCRHLLTNNLLLTSRLSLPALKHLPHPDPPLQDYKLWAAQPKLECLGPLVERMRFCFRQGDEEVLLLVGVLPAVCKVKKLVEAMPGMVHRERVIVEEVSEAALAVLVGKARCLPGEKRRRAIEAVVGVLMEAPTIAVRVVRRAEDQWLAEGVVVGCLERLKGVMRVLGRGKREGEGIEEWFKQRWEVTEMAGGWLEVMGGLWGVMGEGVRMGRLGGRKGRETEDGEGRVGCREVDLMMESVVWKELVRICGVEAPFMREILGLE